MFVRPASQAVTVVMGMAVLVVSPGAAAAGESPAALRARLAQVEAMLATVLERLERMEAALGEENREVTAQAARGVAYEGTAVPVAARETLSAGLPAAAATEFRRDPSMLPAEPSADFTAEDGFQMGTTNVRFGGYTKQDVILTRFSDGALPSSSIGRDFYVPALVPVQSGAVMQDWATDFSIRETRVNMTTATPVGESVLTTFLELDFQVTPGGDERVSNSFTPRVRHAWIRYRGWTLGQTYSTFQDVWALPENLDFVGPAEAAVFLRQPLIRFQAGPLEFALEQPETVFTDPADGGQILAGADPVPDVAARYTLRRLWGHLRLAGLLRELNEEAGLIPGGAEDSTLGYGVTLSGRMQVGARDDLRFAATAGRGLGRYVGLNIIDGAAVRSDGTLQAIRSRAGYLSYRHFWRPALRSNLSLGWFDGDNPVEFTGAAVTDRAMSLHGNLIYQPFPGFDLGVEYIYARRQLASGEAGDMNRVQFSTRYAF